MVTTAPYLRFITCLTACFAWAGLLAQPLTSGYFTIERIPIPDSIALEVGGLAFDDAGNLGVATRRGEVWVIEKPGSVNPVYRRFAHGLHEPLGLNYRDGAFYCAQRGELTRLTDRDGDGRADRYEALYTWDLSGNYHEYSYGPVFTPEGDMLVTLNLGWIGRGASLVEWRGWLVKISPQGELTPVATGLRSPAGFGYNAAGDLFYTENQGDWVGSGRMTHLEPGDFAGNPEGLRWTGEPNSPLQLNPEAIDDTQGLTLYEYAREIDALKPPSVWFPHAIMGTSTSGFVVLDKQFGPEFEGQLLVGDQGQRKVMRVAQEKVNGVYQGACFPFADGFPSGVLRLEWSPQRDALYVGMTSRGWFGSSTEPYGLQRIVWNDRTPFELQTIRVHPEGFELAFTQPADPATLADPASYEVTDFTYLYHHFYGSPVSDAQPRPVKKVTVGADGKSAVLHLDRFRPGYIYEIKAPGVRSRRGQPLWQGFGYYTLNEVPAGGEAMVAGGNATKESANALGFAKRQITLPAGWTSGPDTEIVISTQPGLKYDTEVITLRAGARVQLTLRNTDDMLHNLVIVAPGQADAVGEAALQLGLQGEAQYYVPEMDEVLFHTAILQPESAETIYFTAPGEPGTYQFVCTFPGHHLVMRGEVRVVAGES